MLPCRTGIFQALVRKLIVVQQASMACMSTGTGFAASFHTQIPQRAQLVYDSSPRMRRRVHRAPVSPACVFACVLAAVADGHGKGWVGAQGAGQHHAARAPGRSQRPTPRAASHPGPRPARPAGLIRPDGPGRPGPGRPIPLWALAAAGCLSSARGYEGRPNGRAAFISYHC